MLTPAKCYKWLLFNTINSTLQFIKRMSIQNKRIKTKFCLKSFGKAAHCVANIGINASNDTASGVPEYVKNRTIIFKY